MFSQNDPSYAFVRLGTSRYTIETAGCVLCDLAHSLDVLYGDWNPPRLNRYLATHGGYTGDGRVYWSALDPLGLDLKTAVACEKAPADVVDLLHWVGMCYVVLIKVSFRPWQRFRQHWLLAAFPHPDDIECLDPWIPPGSNAVVSILNHYARPDWDLARAVYGYVAFDYNGRAVENLPF